VSVICVCCVIIILLSFFAVRGLSRHIMRQQAVVESELRYREAIEGAVAMFVPRQFLVLLNYRTLGDVRVGDTCMRDSLGILFAGVRGFKELSEGWTAEQTFDWLNKFFGRIVPAIRKNYGFVDKYVGDTIMALFPDPSHGPAAAIDMQKQLVRLNMKAKAKNPKAPKVRMGVGVHAGEVCLGTLGDQFRVETTIISDAVNLASRLEGLTKYYGSKILISAEINSLLQGQQILKAKRSLGKVRPIGAAVAVEVFDVFETDSPLLQRLKMTTARSFQLALMKYAAKDWSGARQQYKECLTVAEHLNEGGRSKEKVEDKGVLTKMDFLDKYELIQDMAAGWRGEDIWEAK